jgi:hypothetical protein
MLLWSTLADELASGCHTSAAMDIKYVRSRVEHEGSSFFTITLPQFGKDFEKSLDSGCLDRLDFQGFSWRSGLPKLFSGFLGQVFDASSGRLLNEPNEGAIYAVRQLTLFYGKMFLPTSKEKEYDALCGYVECDREVREGDLLRPSGSRERLSLGRVGSLLVGPALRRLAMALPYGRARSLGGQPDVHQNGDTSGDEGYDPRHRLLPGADEYESLHLIPVHGPGATADGLKGNQKWKHDSWTTRLDEVFPMADFVIPNYSYFESLDEVNLKEPGDEIPVKVISVPKTQKTPRIIAVEPTCMMFMQKAIQVRLYELVERDYLLSSFIGFTDQTPNQELACEGSLTGELATLDLSEASDRVSCQHVEDLCRYVDPEVLRAFMAVRSTKADVEGHGVIPLSKYASMGSALTFPLEAMIFLTIVFIGIEDELKRPLTRKDFYSFVGKVRVFGDDIIVPVDYVDSVIRSLEYFGMRVNRSKSFWTGKFRESCGKEYYNGADVSIVRARQELPSSRTDAKEIVSWVETSNLLFKAGCWKTVELLDSWLSGILKDYPVVEDSSPILGRFSFCGHDVHDADRELFSPLVKGWKVRAVIPQNSLDDHYALLKWFTLRSDLPIADEDHLERSGRPLVVDIKRGWGQPF